MNIRRDSSLTLFCFSPTVILLTFLLESGLALYVWLRYRATRFGRLATVFLALLALFQLSELMICRGAAPEMWVRVAAVATAFLPIIGLDFIGMLTRQRRALGLGYATAAAFSVMLTVFAPDAAAAVQCTGRFVAYSGTPSGLDMAYGTYYLATLFLGVGLIVQALRARVGNRQALLWILVGYAAFMVPALALFIFVAASRPGFPSILCGFAVIVAVLLAWKILPLVASPRGKKGL